jgi:hypothetical protein
VRQYLTLPPETFKAFLQEMADSKAAHGLIARTGGRFLGKTEPAQRAAPTTTTFIRVAFA